MLMYIDKIRVYAPANDKCKELGKWIDERYSRCLTDERTIQRIYDEIRERMAALDEQYPRTRRTYLDVQEVKDSTTVFGRMEAKDFPATIFVMNLHRVDSKYMWSEGRNMPVYYGRQEEEEYRRACERRKGDRQ